MPNRCRVVTFVAILLVTPWVASRPSLANATVSGPPNAVTVIAAKSTIREVLEQLAQTYKFELQGADQLTAPVTGNYKGELGAVIGQVLGSTSYLMRSSGGKTALIVSAPPPQAAASDSAPQIEAPTAPASSTERAPPTLSPQAQELAVRMFGEKGRYMQVDETLLRSFFYGRGGRRYVAAPPPLSPAPPAPQQ